MEELVPLLIAAGYLLLRFLSNRAEKSKQPPPRPDRSDEGVLHPLESADTSAETRLERRTSDADAPESLGEALERIRAALEGELAGAPEPPTLPPRQPETPAPLPAPPQLPETRPVPARAPIPAGRIETRDRFITQEDRFEAQGEVFRRPTDRPEKHRHTPAKTPSRVQMLRAPGRLREAILAAEILGPPRSKRRR